MSETTEPLTEAQVDEIATQADRFLSTLTFGEPVRGNRFVESEDQNIYFEETADAEFDAFDLLRQFPALIRDWRALMDRETKYARVLSDRLREMKELGKLVSCVDDEAEDDSRVCGICQSCLTTENTALREQLAQAIKERDEARRWMEIT